jgi:HSP20 family protein
MSLVRWDPFVEMEDMYNRLPAVNSQSSLKNSFVPALDVYEDKNSVIVETPLAGVAPEDVEVSVEKGVLTIRGEHRKEHEVDEKNYYRKEIRSGSFYRQVPLPVPVLESKVNAEFEDGILKITCPKAEPSASKKVMVQVNKNKKRI